MADRVFIEHLLRLNGVEATAPEADLRALFRKAKWRDTEIDAALLEIRKGFEKPTPHPVVPRHAPISSDPSDKISALLGIDVVIDPSMVRNHDTQELMPEKRGIVSRWGIWAVLIVIAAALAYCTGWGAFYFLEIGPYRETEASW